MKKPQTITNSQAEKLLRRLDYQDQLLLRLAIQTGLRIGDLLKLTVGQVRKNMTVTETKTKKERTFQIDGALLQDLKNYTRYKRKASYVFVSQRKPGKPVHRSTIHRRIKKALKTLKFEASAHSARKLYAHNVYADTHDYWKVKEALNHKFLTTTLTYLDIDVEKLLLQVATNEK